MEYVHYMPAKMLYSTILGKEIGNIPYEVVFGAKCAEELEQYGLTKKQAEKLLAVAEMGRRLAQPSYDRYHVDSATRTAEYLMPRLRYMEHEEFFVMSLTTKNRVIKCESVSRGTLTGTAVHPREVFKRAILNNACSIIVAHNHPSGDPSPSKEDMEITKMLVLAGKVMGIPVVDHVVIGDGKYYSFQEDGKLKELEN